MTCPSCGRYSPPDPQTGYDANEPCPECQREGYELYLQATANNGAPPVDPAAIAHQSALQDFATIGKQAETTHDRQRLWELLTMARELEHRAATLTDAVFARIAVVLDDADRETVTTQDSPF